MKLYCGRCGHHIEDHTTGGCGYGLFVAALVDWECPCDAFERLT